MSQQEALRRASEFLTALEKTAPIEGAPLSIGLLFQRGDRGGTLSVEEARAYRGVLTTLDEATGAKRYLTARILEGLVQDAILATYESGAPSSPERAAGVKTALKTLQGELERTPDTWTVYLPVSGVDIERGTLPFGRVRFHRKHGAFQVAALRAADAVIASGRDSQQNKEALRVAAGSRLRDVTGGDSVAEVSVQALDGEGAEVEARHIAAEVGSVLSFYAGVFSRNSAAVHIGEPPESRFRHAFVIRKGAALSLRSKALGRGKLLSLTELKSARAQRLQARWVSRVLAKTSRNGVERRFLSAIVWCGRAHLQERRELRFLLYAIALETLLLPSKSESELGYRLRSRAAHLLAKNVEGRASISAELNKLYSVRSKIVHTGAEAVTDAQLQLIRSHVTRAILVCLTLPELRKMTSEDALETWFERKILS